MTLNREQALSSPGDLASPLRRGRLSRFARLTLRHPSGLFCVVIVALWCAAAVAAHPLVGSPFAMDAQHVLSGPSSLHLLGTDEQGRDVLARVVYGARTSLYVGFLAVLAGTMLGTVVGVTSGFWGGLYDLITQRVVDAFMAIPPLLLALALVTALGESLNLVVLAIALTFAPMITRIARIATCSLRSSLMVQAATCAGASDRRILLRHILPNMVSSVVVLASSYFSLAIIVEASLSFVGFGVAPPQPSWGNMLAAGARPYLLRAPWIGIAPGVALISVALAFNFLGDTLRDMMDPKSR